MCVPAAAVPAASMLISGASAAYGIYSSIQESKYQQQVIDNQNIANRQQAEFNAKKLQYDAAVQRNNQILAERMAQDALDVGAIEESQHRVRIAQAIGTTTAALAGSGFDATAEDAPVLVGDIAATGELEALTIRRNAKARELGLAFEAQNYASQAEIFEVQAQNQQPLRIADAPSPVGKVLGHVGNFAESWFSYKSKTAPAPTKASFAVSGPDQNNIFT